MWFKILYATFLIAEILYGNLVIAGVSSPRVAMSVLMCGVLLWQRKFRVDNFLMYYLIFLLFYAISALLTGYISIFGERFIRLYFVAIVCYLSTKLLVIKYNGQKMLWLLLLAIGLLDSIITIGQVLQLPLANDIPNMLSLNIDETFIESMDNSKTILQFMVFPGIFGAVENAYMLSVVSILAFYNQSGYNHLWNWVVWGILIIGVACTQERTALIASILMSIFIQYKQLSLGFRTGKVLSNYISIVIFVVFIVYGINYLMTHETRFSAFGLDGTGREEIYSKSIDYILSNPIIGGVNAYLEHYRYPHNLFLSALLYGGIFGCFFFILLLYKQLKAIIPYLRTRTNSINSFLYLFSISFIVYTINSLTHNLSIVSGDATPWILMGAIVGLINNSNYENLRSNT